MVKSELPPCVDGWSDDEMGEWKDKFQDLSPMLRGEYFSSLYANQKIFINALVRRFHLTNKKLVSIGAGSGGEEILFRRLGLKYVECIEPDLECANQLEERRKMLGCDNFIIKHCWKEDFVSNTTFDCIYTSSPSDWMYFYSIEDGIPKSYLDFIAGHSSQKSYSIMRLYGAKFSQSLIESKALDMQFLVEKIMQQLSTIGFDLIELWCDVAQPTGTLLIASNFDEKIEDDFGMLAMAYRHQHMIQPNLVYKL